MSAVMEKEAVVIPQGNFDKLPEPIRSLVNSQPMNVITWGVLRKSCNIQVPPKFNGSASQLIEYINALDQSLIKFPKTSGKAVPNGSTPIPTTPRDTRSVDLRFDVSRQEYGRCNFTCTAYGRARVTFSAQDVRDALGECDGDIDSAVDYLREQAEEDCWDDVDWGDTDDYDYEEYDTDGSEDDRIEDVSGVDRLRNLVEEIYNEEWEDED